MGLLAISLKDDINMATKNHTDKRPWYLKKIWAYTMCFITPFIGLINVLWHQGRLQNDEEHIYILISLFMSIVWVMLLFPYWLSVVILVLMAVVLLVWPVDS